MVAPLDGRRRTVLRLGVITAQVATLVVSWPLWQLRSEPPLLPALPLPAISFGPWLLASLALAVARPLAGAICHAVVLLLAILADQTREQPQVLSMALLLFASLPGSAPRAIGVLHLAALWFWSGLGKLTSERFLTTSSAWLLDPRAADALGSAPTAAVLLAVGLGSAEIALGMLALVPRAHPLTARLGLLLHTVTLLLLASRGWNPAVWPWNAALAASAWLLLREAADQEGPLLDGTAVRLTAVAFVALPLGFHAGLVDAPFAGQVYTSNACHGLVLRADGRTEVIGTLSEVRAQLPPVPRLVRAWFAATARPGDRMILVDDRPLGGLLGPRESLVDAPWRAP